MRVKYWVSRESFVWHLSDFNNFATHAGTLLSSTGWSSRRWPLWPGWAPCFFPDFFRFGEVFLALLCRGCWDDGTEEFRLFWFSRSSSSASLFHKKWMMSFASSGESKSGGGGNVFLFIPPDCHRKKITQVECGIKLTQSHKFAVNSSWVNSYDFWAKNVLWFGWTFDKIIVQNGAKMHHSNSGFWVLCVTIGYF